jgi:drug/metabolite transporter (DMT)-like permease
MNPRPLLAVALIVSASVAFAGMGALAKLASREVSSLFVIFGRSAVLSVLAFAVVRARGIPLRIVNRRQMLWRCVVGFVAMMLYFYALSAIPLGTAVTLQYLNPILVALLSGLVLQERATLAASLATVIAFAGAALIVGPEFSHLGMGAIAALGSATLAAFAYLSVRALRRTDAPEMIVLTFGVFSTLGASVSLLGLDAPPSAETALLLLGVGVLAFAGQLLMTYAFRYHSAPFVSAFSYATIVFGALIGVVFLGERPSAHAVVGALLVIGAGVGLSIRETRT